MPFLQTAIILSKNSEKVYWLRNLCHEFVTIQPPLCNKPHLFHPLAACSISSTETTQSACFSNGITDLLKNRKL